MATDGPEAEVDLERLPEISGGDTEFEQELAGEYVNQAAELLQEIGEAAARGDAEPARRAAHTLKGSSQTIGARKVAGVAAEIEQLAAAGGLSAAVARLGRPRASLAAARGGSRTGKGRRPGGAAGPDRSSTRGSRCC